MKKRRKHGRMAFISALLCALMVLSLNPISTLAEGEGTDSAVSAVTTTVSPNGSTQAAAETESTAVKKTEATSPSQAQQTVVEPETAETPVIPTVPTETAAASDSTETTTSVAAESPAGVAGTTSAAETVTAGVSTTSVSAAKAVDMTDETKKYPAFVWNGKVGENAVKISAPEGAFPEGIKVDVKKVDANQVLSGLKNATGNNALTAENILAYDFNFYTDESNQNIEPKKDVKVTFSHLDLSADNDVRVYHIDSENNADRKRADKLDKERGVVELSTDAFSIYAIVSTSSGDTDGKIWIGDDTATTYSTINDAVKAASEGATIHIKGQFAEDRKAAQGATVNKNITLDIAGDTTMTGNASYNGITLAGGSHLQCSNGASLTMTGFKTALETAVGSEINDGIYQFQNNKDTFRGIHIAGSVKGSTDKNSVSITATDTAETDFYEGSATFENCTLDVTSQTWTWFDARALKMKGAALTLSGFGQGYYVEGGSIVDSVLHIKEPGLRWGFIPWGGTGITFQGKATEFTRSTLQVDYGSTAAVSIGLSNADTAMTFKDSTLDLKNGGTGGLNVNTGNITLDNTVLKGNGKNTGALFGAQKNEKANGKITILNDSLIETPAKKNSDNGLGQNGSNYIVTGGSFLVKYTDSYYNGAAIPVNGEDNGNEKLDLVTLADNSINTVSVMNKNGRTYDYHVANTSSDNEKHVFVPTVKVTFKLNSATASFADGTVEDKTEKAIRGNAITLIQGADIPADPANSDASLQFLGWYYTDADGSEVKFDSSTVVKQDMTVYAKWSKTEDVTASDNLYGDILIGDDTGNEAVHSAAPGEALTYTGRLVVAPVKDKIQSLKDKYGGDSDSIQVSDISSTFTASMTIPDGMKISDSPMASLTDNNLFEISSVKKDGKAVIVTMTLKKSYATFKELYTDVMNVPDILDVNVSGVNVGQAVGNGELLTVKGSLEGTFTGTATVPSGHKQNYDFQWTGVQTAEGKDFAQAADDDQTIQYTVKVKKPTEPTTEPTTRPTTPTTEPAEPTVQPAEPVTGSTAEQAASATTGSGQTLTTSEDGKQVPDTGDHMNLTLWLVVLIAAAVASVITLALRRRTED